MLSLHFQSSTPSINPSTTFQDSDQSLLISTAWRGLKTQPNQKKNHSLTVSPLWSFSVIFSDNCRAAFCTHWWMLWIGEAKNSHNFFKFKKISMKNISCFQQKWKICKNCSHEVQTEKCFWWPNPKNPKIPRNFSSPFPANLPAHLWPGYMTLLTQLPKFLKQCLLVCSPPAATHRVHTWAQSASQSCWSAP